MQQEVKRKIISEYKTNKNDTGSPVVQIAILTQKIKDLSAHLKTHPKDNDSKRGLIGMVADRRRHLNYLKRKNQENYDKIVKKLSLA